MQYISFFSVSGECAVLARFCEVSCELDVSVHTYMMIQQCSPQAFFNSFHYPFLPARASEQGNVIGLVSVCVRT